MDSVGMLSTVVLSVKPFAVVMMGATLRCGYDGHLRVTVSLTKY